MIKQYPLREYVAHLFINTPFEEHAFWLKKIIKRMKFNRQKHPELEKLRREFSLTRPVMQRLIQDPMNCIDVGAHLGSVLSQILKFSPHGNHIAIEPVPYKAQWLREKFPTVEVHQVAVSDAPSIANFHYYLHQSGFSGLQAREPLNSQNEIQFTVKCERLDDLIPADKSIDFIKVDIEGNEFNFFRGAQQTLQRCQPHILFECTRSNLRSFNLQPIEIFDFLTQHHYAVFFLEDWFNANKPLDIEQFSNAIMHYPFQAFNFLATQRAK
ncbi:FkbM family methyltransferase [Thioploca ingrica]|uniref:FkbM family methyltransferase n=1 Tax=Thioploca ingrica TaxID=40754 RepID=A0A090AIN5_9GAMM|nr:FkbM family methyltransferase [Thioploca ingrica]